jgi:hypothetical protein
MREGKQKMPWLVLVYQFPKGPGSPRVKIWRRLQQLGAVAIKNSVYVLPSNDQTREDMQWLLTELGGSGADGVILESQFVDGMSDEQMRSQFNAARDSDYEELAGEIGAAIAALPDVTASEAAMIEHGNTRRAMERARKRMAEIEAIDFFGAAAHEEAAAAIRRLQDGVAGRSGTQARDKEMANLAPEGLRDRVWVTRTGVRVDRIASAWLIRRWIDPAARFKFVAGKKYQPASGEIRFDMFDGEFTHDGELCTFEVLARLVDRQDEALRSVGEIVHDIDLKDGKFGRPETEGCASLLAGIVAGMTDDMARIERGGALFDDLYRFFSEIEV